MLICVPTSYYSPLEQAKCRFRRIRRQHQVAVVRNVLFPRMVDSVRACSTSSPAAFGYAGSSSVTITSTSLLMFSLIYFARVPLLASSAWKNRKAPPRCRMPITTSLFVRSLCRVPDYAACRQHRFRPFRPYRRAWTVRLVSWRDGCGDTDTTRFCRNLCCCPRAFA